MLDSSADSSPILTRLKQTAGSGVGRMRRLAESELEHDELMRRATIQRYQALDAIRPHSLRRTSFCRRKRIAPTVQIQRGEDGKPHFSGLETCSSVWACPVCAAIIMAERAHEVTSFANSWREQGGETYMLTCTISHGMGDNLRLMREGLAHAWRRFWQGRAGQERRRAMGIEHTIRAVEVTHGPNGWHPHVHTFLGTNRKLCDADRYEIAVAWQAAVRAVLGSDHEPNLENGVHLTESIHAEYLAKLGLETAHILSKQARGGHRTSWQIMHDAVAGDAESVGLWRQYTQSMHGARQLTWSRGTKRWARLAERSDEELVDAETGEVLGDEGAVLHVIAEFEGKTWDQYSKTIRYWTTTVVAAALGHRPYSELAGMPGVRERSPPGIVRPQCPTVSNSHP